MSFPSTVLFTKSTFLPKFIMALISTLMFINIASAKQSEDILSQAKKLPERTKISLLIQSPNNIVNSYNRIGKKNFPYSRIYNHSEVLGKDRLLPPASTQKILTALAAKWQLGDSFRFSTSIERHGKDIIVKFNGDPSFTGKDLYQLIKRANLQTIEGDLILDGSAFTGYEKAVGWPWDNTGVCYSTGSSAITINGNCVRISLEIDKESGETTPKIPTNQPIKVFSDVIAMESEARKESFCNFYLNSLAGNEYHLSGCINKIRGPLPLNFALQDTGLYTKDLLTRYLTEMNISLHGDIKISRKPFVKTEKTTQLSVHRSAPLPVLLKFMLEYSNNLYADNIAKTIGGAYFNQQGSYANASAAIKALFKEKANINLSSAIFEDGSGLSRNNRMTPTQMLAILNHIRNNNDQLKMLEIMPSSGVSGTLRNRVSMRDPKLKGRIVAKSGSIFGVRNMVGFALDKQGNPTTAFVQFVSDYFADNKESNEIYLPVFEKFYFYDMLGLEED